MVVHSRQLIVRFATEQDTLRLANLIHFEAHVHRHLDWRPPLEWVGNNPYLVGEKDGDLLASLACPQDPAGVAWIRLFAVASSLSIQQAWDELWMAAMQYYSRTPVRIHVAAIPLQGWLQDLLEKSGFIHTHRVVVLSWKNGGSLPEAPRNDVRIRPMNLDDLPVVERVDAISFAAIWQNSLACIEDAYRQSAIATVAEVDGKLVGYQISTTTPLGGHLARLAVIPHYQGKGIGYAILCDTISQFVRRGARTITVNTQHDNDTSLALYLKTGFQRTGEEYPVYQYDIN